MNMLTSKYCPNKNNTAIVLFTQSYLQRNVKEKKSYYPRKSKYQNDKMKFKKEIFGVISNDLT